MRSHLLTYRRNICSLPNLLRIELGVIRYEVSPASWHLGDPRDKEKAKKQKAQKKDNAEKKDKDEKAEKEAPAKEVEKPKKK